MYLNERSWQVRQDNEYIVKNAMTELLQIYSRITKEYNIQQIGICGSVEQIFQSQKYPLEKWMYETTREERNMFRIMWERMLVFQQEDEYEFEYNGVALYGATEAVLNDSCLLSVIFEAEWKNAELQGVLISVQDDDVNISVPNLYQAGQLDERRFQQICSQENLESILIYDYTELWERKEELFPHLRFCPSVQKDFKKLERKWIKQIIYKLQELEEYCRKNAENSFDSSLLKNADPESDETLKQYKKEHTFVDENGESHLAKWHLRFTGIPGRIFFERPDAEGKILIYYIGKKLKNVLYPT